MKKGINFLAFVATLLFSIDGFAQINKLEKGHGPQLQPGQPLKGLKDKTDTSNVAVQIIPPAQALEDLNKPQNSKQLMTIADESTSTIQTISTIQDLNSALEKISSKLMAIKPANKDAMNYINGLAMNIKMLASKEPKEIMAASMMLHKHLSELPMTLKSKNLQKLHNAALKLQTALLKLANKKAALALKEAKTKKGEARDMVIVEGLAALPLHEQNDEVISLRTKSLDLLKQLNALKSPSADSKLMEIQTKAMELQMPNTK